MHRGDEPRRPHILRASSPGLGAAGGMILGVGGLRNSLMKNLATALGKGPLAEASADHLEVLEDCVPVDDVAGLHNDASSTLTGRCRLLALARYFLLFVVDVLGDGFRVQVAFVPRLVLAPDLRDLLDVATLQAPAVRVRHERLPHRVRRAAR